MDLASKDTRAPVSRKDKQSFLNTQITHINFSFYIKGT